MTYSLGGGDADSFSIVDTSGQLRTKAELDYETPKKSYTVTVTATDSSNLADTITVTITVTNVDEPGTVTLSPLQPQVGTPLTATLSDPDGNPSRVSWQWARGDSVGGPFTNVSGGTTLDSYTPVAADVGKYLRATATYDDEQGAGKRADGVSDEAVRAAPPPGTNDAPVFLAATAARSVKENAATGDYIGSPVTATDADDDTLTYSLSGDDADSFDIVPGSGQLRTKAELDYESENLYMVTVTVTDSSVETDITVTINVENVDEEGTVTLSLVQPQVGTELTATLTDLDGTTLNVTWQWTRGENANVGSGASYTPVAADVGEFLRATASYADPHGGNKSANKVSTHAVLAAPTGPNSLPVFSAETATRSVPENTTTGANIGTPVTATDAADDTLTYTLTGTDSASFSIVDTSGQLRTKAELDYEAPKKSYTVTVTATDPSDAIDSITVTIAVTNVDEDGEVTLPSPQPQVGTPLTATLSDPDGTTSNVSWQWARGETTGPFTDVSSGETYTPVDDDAGKFLRATASYTDGHGSGKTAEKVSAVVLAAPVANSAPALSGPIATRSVPENTAAGQNIGAPVAATDADSDDTLTYTLEGGDAKSFAIVATSGQLQTKDALDYETKPTYSVTVSVHDGKNADGAADTTADDTIDVTITVTNVDEEGTVTLSSLQPQVGTALTAELSDPDGDPSSVNWRWARGDTSTGAFSNVSNGASYTPAAADMAKHLRATATYTDPQGSGKNANAVSANPVQTAPATNSAPAFSSATAVRSVAENAVTGANIGTVVAATDDDSDDILTYSLSGGDASSFDIVASSGQLQTKAALDYETKNSYTVTVTARDTSSRTAEVTVTITVTNVNETPEVTGEAIVNRAENGPLAVATYAATNPDNGTIAWRLSGADADDFTISNTGELAFAVPPDYEHPADSDRDKVYRVTVEASDGTDAGTLDVTVTVTNEDDLGTVVLPSGAPEVGIELTALLADPDGSVSNETWKWESSPDGQALWTIISGATSASYTPVAGDAGKHLRATASYTDGHGSGKSAQATSTHAVLAAPNSAPAFMEGAAIRSVAENTAAGRNIGAPVTAADTPGDPLSYTLGGTDAASFDIVASSGQLQTKAPLDYETKSSYSVTVTVTDSSSNAEVPVTISVENVDEEGTVELSSVQPQVGIELTATLTDLDGTPSGVIWQWATSTSENGSFTNVSSGVDPDRYTPVAGDAGKHLRATATYTDPQGSGKNANAVSANPVQTAPATNSAPAFSAETATRSVAENTAPGINIGAPVTATDADTLTYSLGGADADSFDIGPGSGQLRTKAELDYEAAKKSYTVTVTATDPSDAIDSITVTINVENVDEDGTVELSPLQPQVGTLLTAELSDPDGNPSRVSWQWARGDSVGGSFANISSGASYTPVAADVDKFLRATATYTDPQGSGKNANEVSTHAVRAAKATNDAPVFSAATAVRSVAENAVTGTNIGTAVAATDADNGDILTYSLGGADADSFDIVPGSGQLQTKGPLDYETKNSYTVVVTATDSSNLADTITVTIAVTNVDEEGTVTLSSLQPQVGTALTAELSDPDGDPSSVNWRWARGDISTGSFSNVSSGASYTPAAADMAKYLRATATYTDPQGSGKNANEVSTHAVRAAKATNDAPVFSAATAVRSVAENAVTGANIGTAVAATDDDSDDILTYSLGGDDASSFDIVASSGQLQTKAALDYETKNSYTVTVTARDTSSRTAEVTVTINVTDVNETPEFPAETATRNVAENTAGGQNIGAPFTATDPDGDTLTYSLDQTGAASFAIVAATGQLQTKSALDYEAKSSYTVTVSVHDDRDASGNTDTTADDTIDVTITVTNVDEPGTVKLSSLQPQVGTPLTATLADLDGTPSGVIWQWATSASKNGPFTNVSSGVDPDRYTPVAGDVGKYLRATASYTDPQGSGKNANQVSTHAVRAAKATNDAPVFSADTATRSVAENAAPGTDIGTAVAATDADSDDILTYSLGGGDADSFDIVPGSGQLQTKGPLDYETKNSYTVVVTATDSSNLADTITVTIAVTNVDEEGTVTLSSLQPQVGTALTAELSDPDGDPSSVNWRWARGDISTGPFTNVSSGASYTPAAADMAKYLRATATYTDPQGSGKNANEVSTHAVRAAKATNDAPVFSAATATRSVAENAAPGTDIGTAVAATDADSDDILTYSLSGDDADSFSIVETSGQLQTKASLDYEAKSSYDVAVTATDPSSGSDTITVTITVTDENEPPVFDGETATRSVAENTQAGEDIGLPVAATDPDTGETLTYTLGGTDAGDFTIDASSGQLRTKTALDRETRDTYSVTVSVSDGKNADGEADTTIDDTITVTITVTGVNEPPAFPDTAPNTPGVQKEETREVAENTEAGTNIGDPVAAEDADDTTLTYTLGGTDAASFDIVETSGQLQTKAALDHETKSSYRVTVTATDPSSGSDTITVTITVTDENEPPVFDGETATRSVAENTQAGETIGAPVAATDPEGDTLAYTLGGTDAGDFTIDASSGQLRTKTALDRETKDTYFVTVSVSDGQNADGEADTTIDDTITVTITVTRVNEPPAFPDTAPDTEGVQKEETREVAENTEAGTNIGEPVAAEDADDATLTYALDAAGAESFTIVEKSGQLQTKAPLDHETKSSYTVTVIATDPSSGSDTISVTITVTDENEPPPAPAAPTVEAASTSGHNKLTVSWQEPDATGIPAITGYDAEYRKKDTTEDWGSAKVTVSGTGATITGVTPNTLYEVQVRAKNDEGESGWSSPGTGSTGTAPTRGNSGRGGSSSSSSGSGGGSYSLPVNNPPVFTEGDSAARSVAENTAADRNIGDPVTATDPDKDPLTYALGGDDSASFTVDEDSGQLKTKAALDFESKSTYTVTVTADDGKKGVATIDVTIAVTDVVEAPIDNPETVSQPFTQVPAPLPVAVAPVVIVNEKGDLGSQGRQGRQGQQGEAGPAGVAGQQGQPGQQGQGGETGPPGVAGPQGPQGPRGSAGPPGYNGSSGVDGPRGLTGEQGPPGGDASTRTKYIALIVAVVTLPLVLLLWVWNWLRTPNRPRNRRPTGRGPRPTQTGRPAHPHGEGPE